MDIAVQKCSGEVKQRQELQFIYKDFRQKYVCIFIKIRNMKCCI